MQFIHLFAMLLTFGQSHRRVVRFNRWSLITRMVLAAASTLASPIAANSLSKKELYVKRGVLVREPESPGSKLDSREPAEDICPPRGCQG